jgi:hypothetical protein
LQVPLVFNGAWTTVDTDIWGAPATADWRQIGELGVSILNGFKVPGLGSVSRVRLDVTFEVNTFTTPTAAGMTFNIVRNDGTLIATGTANAGGTGILTVIDAVPLASLTSTNSVGVSLHTALAAGVGTLQMSAVLTLLP